MPRFRLTRPSFLRRFSSKTSHNAESTTSDGSDTTAATSLPSPNVPGSPAQQGLRKSISLAKLRDTFRVGDKAVPSVPQDSHHHVLTFSVQSGKDSTASFPPTIRRTTTSPAVSSTQNKHHQGATSDIRQSEEPATASPAPASQRSLDSDLPADLRVQVDDLAINPRLVLEEPTPEAKETLLNAEARFRRSLDSSHSPGVASGEVTLVSSIEDLDAAATEHQHLDRPSPILSASLPPSLHQPPEDNTRCHGVAGTSRASSSEAPVSAPANAHGSHANAHTTLLSSPCLVSNPYSRHPDMYAVPQRKIWVKRPGASATLVQIKEDDLVDDVRDMILRKYANSLGRTFDAPDMTLRIVARTDHSGQRTERLLGPEEEMCRTIDSNYPGGQTVDEALIIDVPVKRTPRPSPRNPTSYHAMEDLRPQENGTDYFPPMPAVIQPTLPTTQSHHVLAADHPRSISVLSTGQVPPLPSPGGRRHRSEREHRPKYGRQHTSSPTIITHPAASGSTSIVAPIPTPAHLAHRNSNRPRVDSSASEKLHQNSIPAAPPLPTPPAPEAPPTRQPGSTPPTPGAVVQQGRSARPRKIRKPISDKPLSKNRGSIAEGHAFSNGIISSMLDGSVPPINVLIVEDNVINLRILEGLMKRLKVRWQTAMNGQIAVDKWKGGGYHLVLMDIQMPVMNGLQATKEIRRLERVNGIGVFSSSTPGSPNENNGVADGEPNGTKNHNADSDRLLNAEGLFKSPVIIVALTASSLQSDRHEALAAGCNDFLTKPVNFVWLERKVKEWGCMQALIDFDGWRKWKDYAAKEEAGKSEEQKRKEREQEEKQKIKAEKLAKLQEKQRLRKEEEERKKKEAGESAAKTATVPEDPQEEAAATNGSKE